jgi:cystathionine beta-lyase/cystathionine gamma-synthase
LLRILPTYGVEVSWIDVPEIENYRKAIKPNTKVLYGTHSHTVSTVQLIHSGLTTFISFSGETSSNPLLTVLDVAAFGQLGKDSKVLTVVDNTFCSPYLVKPLKLNIDVVIHSATKYLGGHSDVLAGCATYAAKEVCDKVYYHMRLFGGVLSPFDAFLLERGVKTLPLRMDAHCKNALKLAQFLESHPKIERVLYPGLVSHPHHELAKKLYEHGQFGGMMAFDVKGGVDAGARFVESLKVIHLAVSLGGVESLISHPATMTHRHVPAEDRRRSGISDGMMRFSVGVENLDDLIADLTNALEKV